MLHLVDSLKTYGYGFNPYAEVKNLQSLSPSERMVRFNQQRESYVNHLLEDQAVSILYKYWPGKNNKEIFISSERKERDNVIHQIDFNERNGLFYDGILRSVEQAVANPNSLVALYSPTGKKVFDSTPQETIQEEKEKWLKEPYDIGQLYFLYFDGGKINNIAISVNDDNNRWLLDMAPIFKNINQEIDEEKRISMFLTTPVLLENVDDFLQRNWDDNYHIFRNVHGEDFFLDKVINDMKQAFTDKKKIKNRVYYDQTMEALQRSEITSEAITRGYLLTAYNFMKERGLKKTKFGGGCPGDGAELSTIEQILGYDVMSSITTGANMFTNNISSFSSSFRDIMQRKNKDVDEFGPLTFHCQECNNDHTRTPHQLFDNCPELEKKGVIKPIRKC